MVPLKPRTLGVSTGSRLARGVGSDSFPRHHTRELRLHHSQRFVTPVGGLLESCWVDNLISSAPSARKAIATLQVIETHFSIHWGLRLKAGSTRYLSAHPQDAVDSHRWKRVRKMDLLDAVLTDNCCPAEPFKVASRMCWSSFFNKFSHEGYRSLKGPQQSKPCRLTSLSCHLFVRGGLDGLLARAWQKRPMRFRIA